jgi:hypothetical protein
MNTNRKVVLGIVAGATVLLLLNKSKLRTHRKGHGFVGSAQDSQFTKTALSTAGDEAWLGSDREISIPKHIIEELKNLRSKDIELAGSLIHDSKGRVSKVQLWNLDQNTWEASLSYDSEVNFHTHDDRGYERTDINMPSPADFGVVLNWSMPHHFNQAHIVVGREGFYIIQVTGALRARALVEFNKGLGAFQSFTASLEKKLQKSVNTNIFLGDSGRLQFTADAERLGFMLGFFHEDQHLETISVMIGSLNRVGELPYDKNAIIADSEKQTIERPAWHNNE